MAVPDESATFTTPPGGVVTKEAGVVNGDFELWLDGPAVRIRPTAGGRTYTVLGVPSPDATCDAVADALAADPGLDFYGHPAASRMPPDQRAG